MTVLRKYVHQLEPPLWRYELRDDNDELITETITATEEVPVEIERARKRRRDRDA